MNKLKQFLKNHTTAIIVILLVLLFLKSCQSCSRKQQMEWGTMTCAEVVDSLNEVVAGRDYVIDSLNNEIKVLVTERDYLKQYSSRVEEENNNIRSNERDLIKTIKNNYNK